MKQLKDTYYLKATGRISALETRLCSDSDYRRMISSKTAEEAYKLWADRNPSRSLPFSDCETAFSADMLETYKLIDSLTGNIGISNVFRFKYDALNLKALVKSDFSGSSFDGAVSPLGNIELKKLASAFKENRLSSLSLPKKLTDSAILAKEVLSKSSDPQKVDILIDKAALESMAEYSSKFENGFIRSVSEAIIDTSNIRTFIRVKKLGRPAAFLENLLALGGAIAPDRIKNCFNSYDEFFALLERSRYGSVLSEGFDSLRSGTSLTKFENLCDRIILKTIDKAKYVSFGIEPVVAYIIKKEYEIKNVRIITKSKKSSLPPENIEERVRFFEI